jgi:putative endonuclease
MPFFVYIIANQTDSELYKGFTENPEQRLAYHNAGESKFTSTKQDWYFVFLKAHELKKEALIDEKRIKKLNSRSLLKLINSEENILGKGSIG